MYKLSNELLDKCIALLYRAWAEAYDNLKKVKVERKDGSPDWDLFHNSRLKNATEEEAKLKRLLDELYYHLPQRKL